MVIRQNDILVAATRIRLLLVADDPTEIRSVEKHLASAPSGTFDVTVLGSSVAEADQTAFRGFDAVLCGLSTGRKVLDSLWAVHSGRSRLPTVALVADGDQRAARYAIQRGAQEYLNHSEVTPESLERAVRRAHERFHWLKRPQDLEQQIRAAALIQERLLPSAPPVLAGFEIAGRLHPSGHIGGDFYDFIELSPGRVGLVLGDASGKGIPGALLMSQARAVIRSAVLTAAGSATHAITVVNQAIHRDGVRDQFVTLFYAVLEESCSEVGYVNAGHPRALLFRSIDLQTLPATGPPLGVLADERYEAAVATIAPGDILVIYSDGVTEAQTAQNNFFGEIGIRRVVDRHRDRSASDIANALCEAAERFEHSNPDGGDDKAALVVRVTGS
jgi:serine phosphatase RsbU (regulator of sigma subunit)